MRALLLALSLTVFLLLPLLGVTPVAFRDLLLDPAQSPESRIFWYIRVPRVLFALVVGGALASCGAVYQAIFRNPLACPFSLGISSAAALGASLAIVSGAAVGAYGAETIGAAAGALGGMACVVALSRRLRGGSSLLLCGVVLSFFFSSLVALIQYISDYAQLFRLTRWMLGSLQVVGYFEVTLVAVVSVAGLVFLAGRAQELNLLSLGSELAGTRGVAIDRVQSQIFIVTSIMVGVLVAVSGVIGFVGIIVPHILRLRAGVDNRILLPASFWFGGILLSICDTIGRILVAPYEIPVGVITALIGGPFFLWVLFDTQRTAPK